MRENYNEIVRRIKNETPDFDENRFYILICNEKTLNGVPIESFTLSKDHKWVCIPVKTSKGCYIPICYEVEQKCDIKCDNFITRFFILNKR